MNSGKIQTFMQLAGQEIGAAGSGKLPRNWTPEKRKLGAQLLLSEVLEYVIHGLGVLPEVNGLHITEPDAVHYHVSPASEVDRLEMIDGLADVAYTMFWNSCAFAIPLEEAFELVCDNNLEKFVPLPGWDRGAGEIPSAEWHCNCDTTWPPEVATVSAVPVGDTWYAVGKDKFGKVRKPSHYTPVDLTVLLAANG